MFAWISSATDHNRTQTNIDFDNIHSGIRVNSWAIVSEQAKIFTQPIRFHFAATLKRWRNTALATQKNLPATLRKPKSHKTKCFSHTLAKERKNMPEHNKKKQMTIWTEFYNFVCKKNEPRHSGAICARENV